MTLKTAFVLLAAASTATFAVGCGASSDKSDATGSARASLHRAKGCGDLLADLKADAAYKLNLGIDRQIQGIQKCIELSGEESCASGGYYGYPGGGVTNDTGALPPGEAGAQASGAPESARDDVASDYSQTNVQVKGVDEADIVKTDGKNLYVIHGNALEIMKAWPASDLAVTASAPIEGQPSEMFVADGKAVVYSTVNGATIFQQAGVTPKAQYTDYFYGYGGVAPATGAPSTGAATPVTDGPPPTRGGDDAAPTPADPDAPTGPTGPQLYVPLTKITVLSLDGAAPAVTREVYFEGGYLDSRRVGDHVRTVLEGAAHGPALKYGVYELGSDPTAVYPKTGSDMIAALEQLRSTDLAIIDASTIQDWLPYTFTKDAAGVHAQTVACEDFYVPTVGSTEAGLTEIAAIDLSKPDALPRQTAILGRADTVYGSADTLYLAAHAWVEPPFYWVDGSVSYGSGEVGTAPAPAQTTPAEPPPDAKPTPTPAPAPGSGGIGTKSLHPRTSPVAAENGVFAWPQNMTHIHEFDFVADPGFPNYVASGTVVGSVKDQFSLDAKDGYLRVATTDNRYYVDTNGKFIPSTGDASQPSTVNHVFVLAPNGGWLDQVGDAGDLAPNERIQSVRFVGARGYVTTFRQVDPLFVVDLAEPAHPAILGALTIPGFSEYMHPLDENHLLTIGRDAGTDGRTRGLKLQIFDVTNGAAPALVKSFTYSASEYGSSEAEYDHKAFTFFDDRGLLAFPYYAYGGETMRSSLELFHVDLATGFQKLGSIDHSSLVSTAPSGYCGGYFGPEVRRGVFLENFVYSVSYGGVIAKDTANLAADGVSVALPTPELNDGYGPPCAVY
jgi:uncharacterized secreted protein with C-terminal beta-propeller domain